MVNRREFLGTTIAAAVAASAITDSAMAGESPSGHADTIVELRQYTLRGGKRDTLIQMFEEKFQQPLNDDGVHVIGSFRDLDDPDRFVWLRGFPDMASRPSALSKFYYGPVWKASREAANATMLDSDNVLLLKPAAADSGFGSVSAKSANKDEIIGANIYYLGGVDAQAFVKFFDESMLPQITKLGAKPIARFITEESPNNFPALPVREHDRVFIWFARWPNLDAENAFAARFHALSGWRDNTPEALFPALMRKPERLRLAPNAKSELR